VPLTRDDRHRIAREMIALHDEADAIEAAGGDSEPLATKLAELAEQLQAHAKGGAEGGDACP
jgi:hypothetical protein